MKRLLLILAMTIAAPAWAHTDAMLDTMAAPHGGQLRMAGPYHFELVVKPGEVTVYVTDHGNAKQPMAGASGTATVLSKGAKTTVKLAPAGDNVLKGGGKFETAPDMKVVISVTMKGQAAQQARFEPMKKQ